MARLMIAYDCVEDLKTFLQERRVLCTLIARPSAIATRPKRVVHVDRTLLRPFASWKRHPLYE